MTFSTNRPHHSESLGRVVDGQVETSEPYNIFYDSISDALEDLEGGVIGDQGPVGDQGPIGEQGPIGDQGPAGTPGIFRGALVYPGGSTPNVSGINLSIPFDAEEDDTDNIHDTGSNTDRLVVPAGVTRVILRGSVQWEIAVSTFGNRSVLINKNGGSFIGFPQMAVKSTDTGLSTILNIVSPALSVVAGDFFTLVAFQDSGVTINILGGTSRSTWFSMEIVE